MPFFGNSHVYSSVSSLPFISPFLLYTLLPLFFPFARFLSLSPFSPLSLALLLPPFLPPSLSRSLSLFPSVTAAIFFLRSSVRSFFSSSVIFLPCFFHSYLPFLSYLPYSDLPSLHFSWFPYFSSKFPIAMDSIICSFPFFSLRQGLC